MDHFSQIGVLEVFLEAAPTTFLLVILIVSGNSGSNIGGANGLQQLLVGNWGGWDLTLFVISCASSIFSFAFGVSRYEYGGTILSLTMSSSLNCLYFKNYQNIM